MELTDDSKVDDKPNYQNNITMESTNDSKVDDKPKSAAQLMQSLTKHVHNLPQELFDEIQDLVFSIPPEPIVTVTKNWRPPLAAQISREISAKYTKPYYRNTIFKLKLVDIICHKWVDLVTQDPYRFVQVRLATRPSQHIDDLGAELCCKHAREFLEKDYQVPMQQVDFSFETKTNEGVPRITKNSGKFRDDPYFAGSTDHVIWLVGHRLMCQFISRT